MHAYRVKCVLVMNLASVKARRAAVSWVLKGSEEIPLTILISIPRYRLHGARRSSRSDHEIPSPWHTDTCINTDMDGVWTCMIVDKCTTRDAQLQTSKYRLFGK